MKIILECSQKREDLWWRKLSQKSIKKGNAKDAWKFAQVKLTLLQKQKGFGEALDTCVSESVRECLRKIMGEDPESDSDSSDSDSSDSDSDSENEKKVEPKKPRKKCTTTGCRKMGVSNGVCASHSSGEESEGKKEKKGRRKRKSGW